jgi:hypothetical protein
VGKVRKVYLEGMKSSCEGRGRCAMAETKPEEFGCDAVDGEVSSALITALIGVDDLTMTCNVGRTQMGRDGWGMKECRNEGAWACWACREGNVGVGGDGLGVTLGRLC